VRYALVEALAILCHQLDTTTIKKELAPFFENLLKDPDQEVKSISIMKLGDILDKIGSEQLEGTILPTLTMLTNDPSLHVRISVATILIKLPEVLSSDVLLKSVLPII